MSLFQESFEMLSEQQSMRLFNVVLGGSQLFGGAAVFLVAIWMGGYEDGFAWSDDPERQFHYHPTFMTMGLVFLYGEALLVYRVFRNERKRFSKLLHLTLHTMVLIFMIIALKAVWDSHDYHQKGDQLDPLPNLYSLHSWIGISVVVAYCIQMNYFRTTSRSINPTLQYVSGFATFFFPGCWTQDKQLCGEQVVSNFLGLTILAYCASVVIIVLNPRWRRRPLPEEESLHQLTTTD
ncbi:unnamed protein product [Anisakis simplex]|uniref:Putative cytochrome b561 (inferred by orthology to a C. elegans protein) n=1 Tax=Anisakis simplex TaxID=6269 RepID=A0A0M3K4T6_ANISI|nr:unnamed protein product [Anisakis simplex]